MQKVFLVSGFLGSGKSSFIIKLIKYFSSNDIKTALIVNEAGEIGIDNQYMKQLGYNIWELFGGCICCTLSSNLENTFDELISNYNPEVVIIEPSGAADPNLIYNTLLNIDVPKSMIHNFLILDPTRVDMFIEILAPLFYSSLDLCNEVIVNKIDVASNNEIKKCEELITSRNLYYCKIDLKNDFPEEYKNRISSILKEE